MQALVKGGKKEKTNMQTKNTKQVMLVALLGIALMLSTLSFVLAEDSNDSSSAIALYNDTSNLPDGIVIAPAPGNISDDFNETSSWKIGWQQIKIAMTFNEDKKAQMELKLAEMRLNQARHAAKNNNSEAMQKALEAHDRIIQKIQERVQKMESRGDENSTKEKIGNLYALQQAVQVHEERIAKLGALLENENLTEQEKQVIQMRLEKAQNNTAHLQEVQTEKEDKLKTKLMAVANITEEQAQSIVDALRESKDKEEFKKNMEDAKQQVKEQREQQREERKQQRETNQQEQESEDDNDSVSETDSD